VVLGILCVSSVAVGWIDGHGRLRLVERGDRLVDAILQYETATGHPPARLEDLVPRFLPSVPSTGCGAFPDWLYVAQATEADCRWTVSVLLGTMLFDFKHLSFDPTGRYPPDGGTRIGRWVVVNP
jgi:hypothetical protein